MSRILRLLLCVATLLLVPVAASAAPAIEPFASYEPATTCHPRAQPGTVLLGHWLVRRYGGGFGPISRSCHGRRDVTSEHNEGRAFDWLNDATTRRGRLTARAFLRDAFATDRWGDDDALARRMGIMYVIWDDTMYPAWNHFAPEPYLSSSCRTVKHCSATLRHRDHVHISLTRRAARERTSWFVSRLAG